MSNRMILPSDFEINIDHDFMEKIMDDVMRDPEPAPDPFAEDSGDDTKLLDSDDETELLGTPRPYDGSIKKPAPTKPRRAVPGSVTAMLEQFSQLSPVISPRGRNEKRDVRTPSGDTPHGQRACVEEPLSGGFSNLSVDCGTNRPSYVSVAGKSIRTFSPLRGQSGRPSYASAAGKGFSPLRGLSGLAKTTLPIKEDTALSKAPSVAEYAPPIKDTTKVNKLPSNEDGVQGEETAAPPIEDTTKVMTPPVEEETAAPPIEDTTKVMTPPVEEETAAPTIEDTTKVMTPPVEEDLVEAVNRQRRILLTEVRSPSADTITKILAAFETLVAMELDISVLERTKVGRMPSLFMTYPKHRNESVRAAAAKLLSKCIGIRIAAASKTIEAEPKSVTKKSTAKAKFAAKKSTGTSKAKSAAKKDTKHRSGVSVKERSRKKSAKKKSRKSKGNNNKAKCSRGCGRVANPCSRAGLCNTCQYPCGQPGCTKQRRGGKFCPIHAQDRRVCSTEGCPRLVELGRKGDAADKCQGCRYLCDHEGCTSQRGPSGFCDVHAPYEVCSKVGCGHRADPRSASGLCAACINPCAHPNCEVESQAGGYCGPHAKEHAPVEYRRFRDRINETHNERYHNDPDYKLSCMVRWRMGYELKKVGLKHHGKLKLLGCHVGQFRAFIEQFFVDENAWMNWKNHGGRIEGKKTWELDHIMPLASFGDTLSDPKELRKASHWSNLQPLYWEDNNNKGKKRPAGFRWCDDADRWLWDEASGRVNYELPAKINGDISLQQALNGVDDETLDLFMDE